MQYVTGIDTPPVFCPIVVDYYSGMATCIPLIASLFKKKVTKDELEVQTGNGVLALLEVQLEGKKRMTTDAFLRGYQVTEGSFLKRC